ncbi:MAG: sigma-70 family RNA polymerase sigma factor [Candidatus Yanofskybacteria bacterium]|nr:sigma-70 family RNA polymerase sigma factor [Candidatus Yanofskybacteria bacterium]
MNSTAEEFVALYDRCADAIFRHCCFRLFEYESARDVTQETFTRTWKYIAEGGTVHNMRAFLYRVANNLIVDISRKRKVSSLHAIQEKGFDIGFEDPGISIQRMDAKAAFVLLRKLNVKYRDVIVMRYIDELTVREIAGILGESENTISVRIHRGIQKLCTILES